MPRTNLSLDLSDLFDDDDSEGHRLVEFIRKKRGGFEKQNFLYMNYEPRRLSLKVQLEKLAKSQLDPNHPNTNENQEHERNGGEEGNIHKKALLPISTAPVCSIDRSGGLNSLATERPRQSPSGSQPQSPSSSNPLSHKLKSPRLAAIRKSGRVSPSDRLRRYSLKRLKKLCSGRRTLLEEFENASDNFNPIVFSTPFSQIGSNNPPLCTTSNEPDNIERNSTANNVKNKSYCNRAHCLTESSQRQEKDLENRMANVTIKSIQCTQVENKSKMEHSQTGDCLDNNLKRTYTVEKENIAEQIVLNHNIAKNIENDLLNASNISPSHSNRSHAKNSRKNTILAEYGNELECNRGAKMSQICSGLRKSGKDKSVPNTFNPGLDTPQCPQTDMSIMPRIQEVKIPETQDHPDVMIQSDCETRLVPIYRTFNQTCEEQSSKTLLKRSQKVISSLPTPPVQLIQETVERRNQITDDSVKLSDVFTDEENITPKSCTSENNSQAPLNLAPKVANIRSNRFRKHRLQIDSFQIISERTTEKDPQEAVQRRMTNKRYKPLNKPPGLPLNGEDFAQELAQMSNYEILDLRKRNSMGQVFTMSGAAKKKFKLENEIKEEIKRRKQCNIEHNRRSQSNPDDIVCENNLDVTLPVPDQFRDSSATQENILESPLINEKSSDRIYFKIRKSIKKSNKLKKKPVPDVLQQYLEVSKMLPLKNNRKSNNSKRSLFSQEQYEMEVNNKTIDNVSIPCLPSPPISKVGFDMPVEVVSPPPALNRSPQGQQEHIIRELEETPQNCAKDLNKVLAEPPPGFENDCNMSTNTNSQSTIISPIRPVESNNQTTTNSTKNDKQLFKVPQKPASKRVGRRKKTISNGLLESKAASNDSIDSTSSLRRSKRNHVPPVSIVEQVFLRVINNRFKYLENMERKKQQISKTNAQNKRKKDTVNFSKSQISTKPSKGSKKKNQLPVILENYDLKSVNDTEVSNKSKKQGAKVVEKQSLSKGIINTNENVCVSPPIDNLNNIFDQLKNVEVSPKVKAFKVRIARLKPLPPQSNHCLDYVCSATSSSTNKEKSSNELVTWLKTMNTSNISMSVTREKQCSSAYGLCFTELQGVEYAFYDAEINASVGYLRFKPRQVKSMKRAKRFDLNFITLLGQFCITNNDKEKLTAVGDLVVVRKSSYYKIENLCDDIAILMVIKKE